MVYGREVGCSVLTRREEGERASENSGSWPNRSSKAVVGLYHTDTPRKDTYAG